MRPTAAAWVSLIASLLLPALSPGQPPPRVPILLDTDVGSDIDDAFALALVFASDELDLRGITTVGTDTQKRALLVCRFLTMTGRRHKQVAAGADPQPARDMGGQYQYYYHPDVLFNRTRRPEKESAVEFLYSRLKAEPGKVTVVATGPLTNIARLLEDKPESKRLIKRIVLTATETNIAADLPAAQAVFAWGVPLVVVPHDVTAGLKLDEAGLQRVFSPGTALTRQVEALYQLWDKTGPALADPLTVTLSFTDRFCKFEDRHLEVDDKGVARIGKGKANARVATSVRSDEFLKWYVDRIASCLPPARRPVKRVAQGGMPHRVHVAEDFDNDIERRWWMAGKPETKNLPPGSRRACRGVLTHDFDDLLGNPRAMHTAVIFNPVPGPPMGKNTRLSFRYWLKGTGSLRVQIYSLTNGYHRHLILDDLPQGRWASATVDMTAARRPDGTGGPLSEGERIDDIQFYADPTAELIIDDIVLYDAAVAGQKRPFPKRVLFTGWFDSGQRGKEWPGEFEIVPEKGFFWKAARSVDSKLLQVPWVQVGLRGERQLGEATHLSFRYRLKGADNLQVVFGNGKKEVSYAGVPLTKLNQDEWAEAVIDEAAFAKGAFGKLTRGLLIDEISFVLPKGAELLLDDLLLYEPGN